MMMKPTNQSIVLLLLIFTLIGIGFMVELSFAYGLEKLNELKTESDNEVVKASLETNSSYDIENSSGKSWHVVATWAFGLTAAGVFSFVDFLSLLNDNRDKLNDGLDKILTPDAVSNLKFRFSKKILKLWKKIVNLTFYVKLCGMFRITTAYSKRRKNTSKKRVVLV